MIEPYELVIDLFAGGGGASEGIEQALGRPIDIAINHDPDAVAMHQVNHPDTLHYCKDVWDANPVEVVAGRPVGLMWASPDCKHFSKAKGGKPVEKKIRDLAWVVCEWAEKVRPRIIMLENVEEFRTWGPLGPDNKPIKERKGETFQEWVEYLRSCGYEVQWKELRASHYGAPTIRKRLFVIARCDGKPIVWPEPTHGNGLLPERTAAECMDFSVPTRSIFGRKKPLSEATERRIYVGLDRHVLNNPNPFIIPAPLSAPFIVRANFGEKPADAINEPLRTATTQTNKFNLVVPTLIQTSYGEREGQAPRALDLHKPLGTVVGGGVKHSLVAAFLLKYQGTSTSAPIDAPMPTITAGGNHIAEVRAFLTHYYSGGGQTQSLNEPMHTIPTKDRVCLVTVAGTDYVIYDIGMRLLLPRELARAQGFANDYVIDRTIDGKAITKTNQVRMIGNSVCPPAARALVEVNIYEDRYPATVAAAGG